MPNIGLLSDSHGRADTTERGVEQLLHAGADTLIHLGDIGTVEVLDALCVPHPTTDQQLPAHLVFGNTDWDLDSLTEYAQDLDLQVHHPAGRLDLPQQQQLAFCHGHQQAPLDHALADRVKYLCHGHTHAQADQQLGPTRLINPGALFRAAVYSVALLDTDQDRLTFFEIDSA
ncbi:MAG: metallophosphoesterase family protein [Planctomycetota bacterium]